jgi:hypothetical protein
MNAGSEDERPRPRHCRDPNFLLRFAAALTPHSAAWFIWSNRFQPLPDYPDWVYQGWLFARLLTGHALPGYQVAHYPVPNSTVTIAFGLLDLVFQPEVSGKLLLTLAILLFISGSLYLLTALGRSERNPLLFAPLIFAFNYFLLSGELAYFLGLGFFFLWPGTFQAPEFAGKDPSRARAGRFLCALFFPHCGLRCRLSRDDGFRALQHQQTHGESIAHTVDAVDRHPGLVVCRAETTWKIRGARAMVLLVDASVGGFQRLRVGLTNLST